MDCGAELSRVENCGGFDAESGDAGGSWLNADVAHQITKIENKARSLGDMLTCAIQPANLYRLTKATVTLTTALN
jgi:hypothetical protein